MHPASLGQLGVSHERLAQRGNLNDDIFPHLSSKYHKDGKQTGFDLGADYSYEVYSGHRRL